MTTLKSRVLINSLPKSGTHLLSKAVELFGYHEHFDASASEDAERSMPLFFNYREVKNALEKQVEPIKQQSDETICVGSLAPVNVDLAVFRHWLDNMPRQRYILGHVAWTPALAPVLTDLNYHHLFIIRDPRAVVASLIGFILDSHGMPKKHFLEADFKSMSPTQRLDIIMNGGYAPQAKVEVSGFIEVYRSMFAWSKESDCLFIHFEDLVGEQGGGSVERQKDTVKCISAYLGAAFDESVTSKLQEIYNPAARTFRKGSVDSWKQSLDGESIERLTEFCRPLCEEVGYAR